jgi:hypothetical protein
MEKIKQTLEEKIAIRKSDNSQGTKSGTNK